jgi:PPM family protein phosphatase
MASHTRVGSFTRAGRRKTNQDAVAVERFADGRLLLALADGMGGYSGGEQASRIALETLTRSLTTGLSLVDSFHTANRAVHEAAVDNPEWDGMGTTLVALLQNGSAYELANVGDSRAYLLRSGRVRQITQDHSVLAEAERQGADAVEALGDSRWRHALTRALGTDPEIEVDHFGPFPVEDAHSVVLCSDGLYQRVTPEILWEEVGDTPLRALDLDRLAHRLVSLAYDRGSSDNISVLLAAFQPEPGLPPRPQEGRDPSASSSGNLSSSVPSPRLPRDRTHGKRVPSGSGGLPVAKVRLKRWFKRYEVLLAFTVLALVSGFLLWLIE